MTAEYDRGEPTNELHTGGRDRWEVRVVEGPARGGLYELEQETFYYVIDRSSGRAVKTFTGHYEASFTGEGTWGEGAYSGVRQVVIDEGGLCAFAIHSNRMVERFQLSSEPVSDNPALPWRLAGLPLPVLPMTVDGFPVHEETDFEMLVAEVVQGWVPADAPAPYGALPASWLCDLYLRLNGLPQSSTLAAILARSLAGQDDGMRGVALYFYLRIPHAQGRASVLEAVRSRGAAEAVRTSAVKYGERDRMYFAPLDFFAAILASDVLDPFGHAVLEAFREAILVTTTYFRDSHFEALARHAPEWAAVNAPAVVRACPGRLGRLLSQLYRADRSDLVVSAGIALAKDPSVDRKELEAWLAKPFGGLDTEEIRRVL